MLSFNWETLIKFIIGGIAVVFLVSGFIVGPDIISNLSTWIDETLGIGEKGACAKAEDSFWCKRQNMCMIDTDNDVCNPNKHVPNVYCDPFTCTIQDCPAPWDWKDGECTDCRTEGVKCGTLIGGGGCCDGLSCKGTWRKRCS